METDTESGLKSAYEKTREKLAKEKAKNAALRAENERLQLAFDNLAQAIALRNPAPPCSS